MAQLGTADVTYTQIRYVGGNPASPQNESVVTMLFPNGANVLYTSGGIPLSKGQLGCPATIQEFIIMDEASTTGYVAKFDYGASTIRLYLTQNTTAASTTTSLIEFTTAATVASTTLRVIAKGW